MTRLCVSQRLQLRYSSCALLQKMLRSPRILPSYRALGFMQPNQIQSTPTVLSFAQRMDSQTIIYAILGHEEVFGENECSDEISKLYASISVLKGKKINGDFLNGLKKFSNYPTFYKKRSWTFRTEFQSQKEKRPNYREITRFFV